MRLTVNSQGSNVYSTRLSSSQRSGEKHGAGCACHSCRSSKSINAQSGFLYSPKTLNFQQNPQQQVQPGYYPGVGIVTPQSQVPSQIPVQQADDGGEGEEKVAPWIDAIIPQWQQVAAMDLVKQAMTALPDKNPFDKKDEPCISNQIKPVQSNDSEMREVISDIDKDIQDAKVNGQQLLYVYDPTTHAYIEIVNRTGTQLSIQQAIKLIVMKRHGDKDWINAYVDGVQYHEILHEMLLAKIPDVNLEKFDQGVRFVLEGDVNDPENLSFEVTTFGQTVFYADAIYDKVDQNEQQFNQAQQQFNQAQAKGFKGWTNDTFAKLMNGLKGMIKNLQFLAQEATMLGTAAVAPLALHNTIYYEHEVLSAADKERYAEAMQLKDYINKLIGKITAFMSQANNVWASVTGKNPQAPAGNQVQPFQK